MKLKKGKVNNINKKLLTGVLTFTLLTTALTGCTKDFNYTKQVQNGDYVVEVTGTMESKIAEELKVLELDIAGETTLFLARRYDKEINSKDNKEYIYEYWDVFDDFKIIDLSSEKQTNPINIDTGYENVKIVKEESLKKYLQYYEYDKKEYTSEELKDIFNKIQENYKFENQKVLVAHK